MKKSLTLLAVVGGLMFIGGPLHAEDIKRTNADVVSFNHKASSEMALAVSSHGTVYNTDGLVNVRENFPYVVAPSTIAIASLRFSTAALWDGATNIPAISITQPRYPTPLIFQLTFGIATTTESWTSTVTVSGFDSKGSSRTINLTLSTNAVTTGVAFVRVSSISVGVGNSTTTHNNNLAFITVGSTNTLGLANDILSPNDMYAWWENGVLQSSNTVNADFDTISLNSVPGYSVLNSSATRYEGLYRARQSPPHISHPQRGGRP